MAKRVICPNTTFESIKTILDFLKTQKGTQTIKEISEQTHRSVSWINGALPIMGELGLIYRGAGEHRKHIGITSKGIDLINYINERKDEDLKNLGGEIYKKSDILNIANKILSDEPEISIKKFGKKIVEKLEIPAEQQWKNETTYVKVARTCKSLLGGLKVIEYIPQKHKRQNIDRFRNKIMPYASTILLDKLLNSFVKNENDVYRLPAEELTQYQRQRQTDYFNTAISLGLVDRIPSDEYLYKLTHEGRKLKESKNFSEHAKIFQEILLDNPHVVEIIKTIKNNYDEISTEEIGQILCEYNGAKWGDGTKRSYGNNFLNWLLEADILVKRGRKHKYTFQQYFIESDNYHKYFNNDYGNKSLISKPSSHEQNNLIVIQKPLLSNKPIFLFNRLNTILNWLINYDKSNPFSNEKIHQEVIDILHDLINNSNDEIKAIFILSKYLVELAYNENNSEHIRQIQKNIVNIKDYNKSVIDT